MGFGLFALIAIGILTKIVESTVVLGMAAESSAIKNNIGNTVTLIDGTGSPVSLVLAYDDGDLSADGLQEYTNELVHIERRGRTITVCRGKRAPPKIAFSTWVGNIVGSSAVAPGTPLEFVTKKGAYSANVSTLGTGRPMAQDVKYTCEGTNVGDAADETTTYEDTVLRGKWAEGYEGQKIEWTGECFGTVVCVNSTNTVNFTQVA